MRNWHGGELYGSRSTLLLSCFVLAKQNVK